MCATCVTKDSKERRRGDLLLEGEGEDGKKRSSHLEEDCDHLYGRKHGLRVARCRSGHRRMHAEASEIDWPSDCSAVARRDSRHSENEWSNGARKHEASLL